MIRDHREADTFAADVLEGLTRPRGEKAIPAKHLYDAMGSRIFERILDVDDYYPVDAESSIFDACLPEIAKRIGPRAVLVEPGAGDGRKPARLLEALEEPVAFAPLEISETALAECADRLARRFPDVQVHPVCADFSRGFSHLAELPRENRVVFFPGSTVGNLLPEERIDLLSSFARFAGPEGCALVGFDLVKEADVLRAAYDDSEGVTANFNLNLVTRMNRQLGAGFEEDAFAHEAVWVDGLDRIEMRLVVKRPQRAEIDGRTISLEEGERIHTENSHKFTPERIAAETGEAGFDVDQTWTDEQGWYALALLRSRSST
jgi:dimethylhistidine N-methyltransferase